MWDGITIGYSTADETINFGTRAVAIGDSRIFETTTLATIKKTCNTKCVTKEDLKISTMCTPDLMYISAGKSFASFNNGITEINQTFGFPNQIVDAKISDDGCYLIVLLYDWTIYCCSFTDPRILFVKKVSKNPRCLTSEMEIPVGLFFFFKENHFYITVITSSGFINKFICDNVMELTEKSSFDNDLKSITLNTYDIHENVKTVCGMSNDILIAGDSICIYEGENMRSKEFLFPISCKIKKLVFTQDKSFIICLTDTKTMLVVCAFTFIPIKEWDEVSVCDFTLVQEMDTTSIFLLTDETQPSLLLVSMPDFNVTFKLSTSSFTYLVDYPGTSDGLLYLEAYGDDDINTLHIKIISEGQPDLRLARMLRRGKYDEAQHFAATFNLDPEIVYKEQVKGLISKLNVLQPESKGIQKTFEEFMDYLNKIKDHSFVGLCALNAIVPNFILCRKLLRYALLRVKSVPLESEYKSISLLDQLQSTLHKLDTFCLLHNVSDSLTTWSIENTELWLRFCKQDINNICLDLVKKNQLNDSLTVWGRHIAEIRTHINKEFITEYFSNISFSVDIEDLKLWMMSFVSTTLFMFYDETIASMVFYIKNKVRWNELYLHLDWINPSLELSRYFLNIINQIVASPLCLSISRPPDSQNNLILLIKYLTELKELNDNFGVKITLDDYELSHEDNNFSELLFLVLDQIQMNKFANFMSTFWSTFTLQRFLNSDEILSIYIKNIVSQVDCWWSWEEKTIMLLNFICNKKIKTDSVLCVLKAASIPWSELMMKLCDETLCTNLNSKPVNDIEEMKNLLTSKLILKSYNLSFSNITPSIILVAVQNICTQNRPDVLNDIVKLVSTQSETIQQEAFEIYIQHLIESGFTNKAIESITNPQIIPSSIVKRILTTIWVTYDSLRNQTLFVEEASYYFIVLKFLAKSPSLDIQQECRHNANILINIYHLKNEFKIECTLSEYNYEEKLLIKCVHLVLKDKCFNNLESPAKQAKLSRLSNLLFESFENVIVQFVKESALQNNYENICVFGQFIITFENVSFQLATKLLVLGELLVSRYDPVSQSSFKIPLWTLIRRITQLVTVNSQSNLLTRAVELRQWVEPFYLTCGDVVNCGNIDLGLAYSWRNAIIDKNSIHTEFFEQFKLYSSFLNSYNTESSLRYYKKLDVHEDSFDSTISPDKIMFSLEYFQSQNLIGLHMTVTQVLCLYRTILQNQRLLEPELTKKGSNLIRSNVRQILKSVTYSRNLDMDLGLGLLNTLKSHDAVNWLEDALNNVGMNYQKLTNITDLGLVYVQLNHDTAGDLYETLKSTKNKCIWGKKLMKYGFVFKDAFYSSELDQRLLLQKMIKTPNITLKILIDYCEDTNFDLQQTAKLFLESCLIQWEPYTPKEKEEKTFDWIAKIIEDKDALLNKCEEIFCIITDKTDTLDFLWNHVWEQVNTYYYEVFLVIVNLIEKYYLNSVLNFDVQKEILLFLMQYKRVSVPEEHEEEIWFVMFQESQSLPPISKYRLPYVPLASKKKKFGHREINVWKIIKPELTFLTYNKWFSIIKSIGMDKDTLCILTVKNMVNEVANKDKNVEWYLHMRLESLLNDIQKVLSNVKNLEVVAASLYFVVNNLPLGADQLAAAKICHSQAQEWVKLENSENAKSCITKVVTKYVLTTTKHILHMYGFGSPNYLQLALHPDELIRELYNDPIILKRHTGEIKSFPDINSAVDAIVEVHGKGGLALKVDLLKEWLQPSSLGLMGSPSKSLNMSTTDSSYSTQESLTISEGVLRACYLLENDTPAYNLHNFLICQAYNEDDSDSMCPTSVRLRALQCLCLATTKNIEEITCRTKEMMKDNLIELSIITELETLGINFSPGRYRGCDKSKLVQSLLARRSLNATKLASHLCVLYSGIIYPGIWDTLLTRLINFTLINELEKVLIHLMDKWYQLTFEIVEEAWNVLLNSSFNNAKDSFEVIRCIKLVFSCPVIDKVDLKQIIEHCERFQLTQYVQKLKCFS